MQSRQREQSEAALLKRASEKPVPSALQTWEELPPSGQLRMTGPLKVFRPGTSQTNAGAHGRQRASRPRQGLLYFTDCFRLLASLLV